MKCNPRHFFKRSYLFYYFSLAFEIGSHVIQAGLELMILPPQPQACAIRDSQEGFCKVRTFYMLAFSALGYFPFCLFSML